VGDPNPDVGEAALIALDIPGKAAPKEDSGTKARATSWPVSGLSKVNRVCNEIRKRADYLGVLALHAEKTPWEQY
jgi:hypothetical protein